MTIKNENRSNPSPRKKGCFGDSSWGYDMSCGWKEGLGCYQGWGEEVSEKGSVKQTNTCALKYSIIKAE